MSARPSSPLWQGQQHHPAGTQPFRPAPSVAQAQGVLRPQFRRGEKRSQTVCLSAQRWAGGRTGTKPRKTPDACSPV